MRFKLLAVLACGVIFGSAVGLSQDDLIRARRELMQANGQAAYGIGVRMLLGAVPYDAAVTEAAMRTIAINLEKFPALYPADFDKDDTKAAAIWQKIDLLRTMAAEGAAEAKAAADAARSCRDDFKLAYLSLSGACNSCHKEFLVP